MAIRMQELIHKYEMGAGRGVLKAMMAFMAMLALAVWYDTTAFRNLSTQEGMDAAQLARNLAEGRGYSTSFIRPFSLHLFKKSFLTSAAATALGEEGETNTAALVRLDVCRLKQAHPDLSNAPLYPLLLAGALKLMPFPYAVVPANSSKAFTVYPPDLWIAMFNQLLFFLAAVLLFFLSRRLFDESVAWVSVAVFWGGDLFWRFTTSGLSTLLMLLIFLGVAWALASLETRARDADRGSRWLWIFAVVAGALTAAGALTRYSFGWVIIPVALMIGSLPATKRIVLAATAVGAFLLVVTPWVVRNHDLSGTLFGTAGFAIYQNTSQFSENQLERSLNPDFSSISSADFSRKLLVTSKEIIVQDLPRLGGSWVSAFFLVGLLVPFRNAVLGRLRLFVLLCLVMLILVQSLGRTGLAAESPDINSENLLVVLSPLVFTFGVSLFYTLLDQLDQRQPAGRRLIVGLFCLASCLPMLNTLLETSPSPHVYPPYYPPWIEEKCQLLNEGELCMSDVPWAVAWYGRRPGVWLTLKYKSNATEKFRNGFREVDALKPIKALYLSAKTMKSIEVRSLEQWLRQDDDSAIFSRFRQRVLEDRDRGENRATDATLMEAFRERLIANAGKVNDASQDWEQFVLGTFLKSEVPTGFPLQRAPMGLLPELFLTDSEHVGAKRIQSSK